MTATALLLLALASLALSAVPAYFYFRNVGVFRPLPPAGGGDEASEEDGAAPGDEPLSVLIPARDEARNIGDCIAAVLASAGPDDEVVVLDDHSTDGTPQIVQRLSGEDPRVRLAAGDPLPAGWNGKQHACWQLARHARRELFVFLDADVRLSADALPRIKRAMGAGVGLLSGFPRQVTRTPLERLLIPLIHFVLLGFLSLRHLRREQRPEFAAGCGQLFITRRAAYERAGGHRAIRASRHDGIKLPRLYLASGQTIDVFDATDLASVRMYDGARATWNGLSKNADEGVASPRLIVPVTLLLLGGQVAPWVLLLSPAPLPVRLVGGVAAVCGLLPRLHAAWRFRQPLPAAIAHPVSVLLFLAVQWAALLASLTGRQVAWKGRPATGQQAADA
ncbi:MAG: glycosyltransferase family 2 protein [Planctomycetota bacterium]